MNRLICLLALYMLILTGLPCPDAVCHAHALTASAPAQSSHADDESHKSACSPFCHCATCAGFVLAQPVRYAEQRPATLPILPRAQFSYRLSHSRGQPGSIWQPPRL